MSASAWVCPTAVALRWAASLALGLALISWSPSVRAEEQSGKEAAMTAPDFPKVGHEVTIANVPSAAKEVRITYQPDAPVASVQTVPVSSGAAAVVWKPEKAGIARIDAVADGAVLASFERSVAFDGFPIPGVAMFLFAATVLIGGAVWSLRLLLADHGDGGDHA